MFGFVLSFHTCVVRDNTNAEVWAWLALICLEGEAPRVKESMQALDQALLLNLSIRTNTEVLMELAASYSGVGKEQVTEKILQRLMTATDDAHVKLCLAESLARQHKLDDAQPLFREVLKLCDGDDAKAAAAGLALVTEQLGDKSEASRIRAQYRV
jgi:lipopolysaccharide biosynthesis regulator YciM